MSLSLSTFITFCTASVYGIRSFSALHVSPFKHLIKLSLGVHHVLQLTTTLLLSVAVPYPLGMRKRQPIFEISPFSFPLYRFSRQFLHYVELLVTVKTCSIFLLSLAFCCYTSVFCLLLRLSVLVVLPALLQCLCPTTGAQPLEVLGLSR